MSVAPARASRASVPLGTSLLYWEKAILVLMWREWHRELFLQGSGHLGFVTALSLLPCSSAPIGISELITVGSLSLYHNPP